MNAVAALPAFSGASRRSSPLALAVLLHGALLYAIVHGLSQTSERPEPREVVISLISPRAETAPARPMTPPAPAPIPKQAAPQVPTQPQAQPMPKQESEPQPQQPVVRDTPSPVVSTPAPAAAPAVPAPAPVQESRPAPAAPPAPPVVHHAPPAPAERGPVTISSVEYLHPPKPDYPIGAKRAGEQGKVVLRILIDEKGLPERVDIQQSAGFVRLDEAARAAALRAVFKPHLEDGRAVPAYVLVPINFALK